MFELFTFTNLDFLQIADLAACDNNMSSARVARVMRSILLKGNANIFADTMLV